MKRELIFIRIGLEADALQSFLLHVGSAIAFL